LSLFTFAPFVVLALLVAAIRTGRDDGEGTLREDFLGGVLLVGVSIALVTQGLSAFGAINAGAVAAFWIAAVAASAAVLLWRWRRFGPPAPIRVSALETGERLLVIAIVVLSLVLLVVAWLSPPQSSDSVGYHMARVMHWIQNGSLAHYPTADPPQLFQPPFAETVRLHLQLLSGGDRAGCLLQWFAAVASAGAASLLARDLGGSRRAQVFAALFALTLPIGIAQVSNAKNGWLESLWLLALAHFGMASVRRETGALSRSRALAAFAALGLALTTKISAWLFAPAIVLLAVATSLCAARPPRRRLLPIAAAGSLLVCALTVPYLARNFGVYGHPLVDPVAQKNNGLGQVSVATVTSNVVRNVLFQFGTGIEPIDDVLRWTVGEVHEWIGRSPTDPDTTHYGTFGIRAPSRSEERVSSPLHILLLFGAGAGLLVSGRLRGRRDRVGYLAALTAAFVLYSAVVQWQPMNSRLLMPLLLFSAPLVALVVSEMAGGKTLLLVSVVLLVASVPYVIGIESRPLSFHPRKGLLAATREDLYFARVRWAQPTYRRVAEDVVASGTKRLGVVFTDDFQPEYLFWRLVKELDPAVRIENVAATNASAALAALAPFRDFRPQRVVVFASDRKAMRFKRKIVASGKTWRLDRRIRSAGVYERNTGPRAR
jgi:4-amino-4-deoxy-L-arabinose transferase-like glycosyltransferase